jgi:hypothetical protein
MQSDKLSDAVYDIAWSPHDACVFASVTGDGRVEVWDLKTNQQNPCMAYKSMPRESDKAEEPRVQGDVSSDDLVRNSCFSVFIAHFLLSL